MSGILENLLGTSNHIDINLNSWRYWEGDVVEGEVKVLSLRLPFRRYKAQIELKFKGIAHADFGYAIANSSMRLHKRIDYHVIKLFDGEITMREQRFAFRFPLPKECAGSFLFKNKSDEAIGIHYYAKAKLKVPYQLSEKVRQKFEILEKQKKLATPLRAYSAVGKNKMSVWIDRDTFCPGDGIIIRLKIAQNEIVSVVRVQLIQAIEYQKTGRIVHVAQIKELKVTTLPPFFYGTTWIDFIIPAGTQASTLLGEIRMIYLLQFEMDNSYTILVPINILTQQPISSLHPIARTFAPLPPRIEIRPPMQFGGDPTCSLCGTEFTLLRGRTNCRHCGKVFCKSCVNSKIAIPELWYNEPELVCRPCFRIVEETGGVKYMIPKKEMEEWSELHEVQWVPKCSKGDYGWMKKFQVDDFICYTAKDPFSWPAAKLKLGELDSRATQKVLDALKRKNFMKN